MIQAGVSIIIQHTLCYFSFFINKKKAEKGFYSSENCSCFWGGQKVLGQVHECIVARGTWMFL